MDEYDRRTGYGGNGTGTRSGIEGEGSCCEVGNGSRHWRWVVVIDGKHCTPRNQKKPQIPFRADCYFNYLIIDQ